MTREEYVCPFTGRQVLKLTFETVESQATPQAEAFKLLCQLNIQGVTTVRSAMALLSVAGSPGITAAEIGTLPLCGKSSGRSFTKALSSKGLIVEVPKHLPNRRPRREFFITEKGKEAIFREAS